jgi:hypothetical protein
LTEGEDDPYDSYGFGEPLPIGVTNAVRRWRLVLRDRGRAL